MGTLKFSGTPYASIIWIIHSIINSQALLIVFLLFWSFRCKASKKHDVKNIVPNPFWKESNLNVQEVIYLLLTWINTYLIKAAAFVTRWNETVRDMDSPTFTKEMIKHRLRLFNLYQQRVTTDIYVINYWSLFTALFINNAELRFGEFSLI